MNTTPQPDSFNIGKFIENAIRLESEKLMKEAIVNMTKELERRTPEIIAGIIVDIMKSTDMQTFSDRVIFTIRNNC